MYSFVIWNSAPRINFVEYHKMIEVYMSAKNKVNNPIITLCQAKGKWFNQFKCIVKGEWFNHFNIEAP